MKSEVYNQSTCLVSMVAYQYYVEEKSRAEIGEKFGLSSATISRLLKKAKEEHIIEFHISEPYLSCQKMAEKIKDYFHLDTVMVVPVEEQETEENRQDIKKAVALEGARYVQRVITDGDVLGLAWGGTMYHMIQYLNPCRKVNASIVTMHGSIANCNQNLEVKSLVRRAAMAFGGRNVSFVAPGLYETKEKAEKLKKQPGFEEVFKLFEKITIAVSGLGSFYPNFDSLLARSNFLSEEEIASLRGKDAYTDLSLRFIDKDGQECETSLKDRTLAIDLDVYRKIPCKVVMASGSQKAHSVLAVLKGNLADVLIIDYHLAEKLMGLLK